MEKEGYYEKAFIGHLIREGAEHREVAMIPALRGARIRHLKELADLLKLTNWHKKRLNLYISCSKVSEIPEFTFNMQERSKSTHVWFEKQFDNLVFEYDLFIEFDDFYEIRGEDGGIKERVKGSVYDALRDLKVLKEYLDDYKVSYSILFSGNKGFHVIIKGIPIKKIEKGVVYPHKEIAESIKLMLNLKFMDLSHNGLTNRLRKLPYSLVLPNQFKDTPDLCQESLMRVALPLSDEQITNFKVEDMLLVNVYKKVKFMRRGDLERFSELSEKQKKENLQSFINLFVFK